jgi:hypothetical protein
VRPKTFVRPVTAIAMSSRVMIYSFVSRRDDRPWRSRNFYARSPWLW